MSKKSLYDRPIRICAQFLELNPVNLNSKTRLLKPEIFSLGLVIGQHWPALARNSRTGCSDFDWARWKGCFERLTDLN